MSHINVTSEIGRLKKVMLHRPGDELLNLTPDKLEELLFDDIPFLKDAKKEHDYFKSVLEENGAEVFYLEDMMAEVLNQKPLLREEFIHRIVEESRSSNTVYEKPLCDYLSSIGDNKELVLKTMSGLSIDELELPKSNTLSSMLGKEDTLLLDPMPNLYFTRDPYASVGNKVSLHRMYSATRRRETVYSDYIFKHHNYWSEDIEILYDRKNKYHIEGGDILNLSEDTVAIGISQRTQAKAIDEISRNLFFSTKSDIKRVLAFEIPNTRAFMHLDTVFTQVDYDKFTVHPEILGTLRVFEIMPEDNNELYIKEHIDTLEKILEKFLSRKVSLILCGGGDRIAAAREQWNDGSNTLSIAPGKIVVYERNDVSNAILKKEGLEVIEISSGELSRGRGGPRCMSMPLWRE